MKRAFGGLVLGVVGTAVIIAGWMFTRAAPLPRDTASIEADWAKWSGTRALQRSNPPQPAVFEVDDNPKGVSPEQIDALLEAMAAGHRAPVGCTQMRDLMERAIEPSTSAVHHAARALIEHGEPDAAAMLGQDLLDGDFFGFAMGAALIDAARDQGSMAPPPSTADLRNALIRHTHCGLQIIHVFGTDRFDEQLPGTRGVDPVDTRLRFLHLMTLSIASIRPTVDETRSILTPLDDSPNPPLWRILAVQPEDYAPVLDHLQDP